GLKEKDITGFRPVGVWNTVDHLNWGTPSTLRRISFRGPSVGLGMATYPKMKIYDNVIAAFKGADDENIIDRTLISRESLLASAKMPSPTFSMRRLRFLLRTPISSPR
ncbi:NPP1 domain-containing protein, partial [Colletotrichum tamarilloi]